MQLPQEGPGNLALINDDLLQIMLLTSGSSWVAYTSSKWNHNVIT